MLCYFALGRFLGGLFVWRGGSLYACKVGELVLKGICAAMQGYKKCDGKPPEGSTGLRAKKTGESRSFGMAGFFAWGLWVVYSPFLLKPIGLRGVSSFSMNLLR